MCLCVERMEEKKKESEEISGIQGEVEVDTPKCLFAPPRIAYMITELGRIYKTFLYQGEIGKFRLITTIVDNCHRKSFWYLNYIIFSGNNGVYALNTRDNNDKVTKMLHGELVTIHPVGNDNLVAIGGGPGSNPDSEEPGFVDIYQILVNEERKADQKDIYLELVSHIPIRDSSIFSITSRKSELVLEDIREESRVVVMNLETGKKKKSVKGNHPVIADGDIITLKGGTIYNVDKKEHFGSGYSYISPVPGTSLLLGERTKDKDKCIDLFYGTSELATKNVNGWIRNIRGHPGYANTSIILCEEEVLSLNVEKMEFTSIARFNAKEKGYPLTFEIGPVDQEQLKNYLEFIGKLTGLTRTMSNIVVRFL